MTKQAAAPANAATQEEDLPQTAVKPSAKDQYIKDLQDQVAKLSPAAPQPQPTEAEPTDPEEATFKKRYADLRRHAQHQENALKKQLADQQAQIDQLSKLSDQPMPKTKEEFEAWKAKYPDIASFIEIIADEKSSQRASQLQQELGTLKEKLTVTEKDKAFATLKAMVPDLEDVVKSPEYQEWFADQPPFVQDILNTSDDPYQISYYIGIFKLTTSKPVKTNKKDSLSALDTSVRNTGATPGRNSGGHKYTQSQISKMSPQEFEKNEADIIAARNAGQILDDLTKRNTVFD